MKWKLHISILLLTEKYILVWNYGLRNTEVNARYRFAEDCVLICYFFVCENFAYKYRFLFKKSHFQLEQPHILKPLIAWTITPNTFFANGGWSLHWFWRCHLVIIGVSNSKRIFFFPKLISKWKKHGDNIKIMVIWLPKRHTKKII